MHNIAQIQALFNQYLSQHFFQQQPKELYEPINYILQLGGKRLRPALALLGCQVFDAEVEKALPAAYAVEIFHNFSLIHDDIMDEAPLRRGKPTVHYQYGLNAGILSGDVMLIYAYEFLLKTDNPAIHSDLVRVFNQVAIEVCEGQQLDMNFEKRTDVTILEYLKMIELKTAALIGGALELGALTGGATPAEARELALFGRNAGIAFQLQDDWLDAFGDPVQVGKKPGGDIAQNKKTFLILKALEIANTQEREQLLQLMTASPANEQAKIDQVTAILRKLEIPAVVEAEKAKFMDRAAQHLAAAPGTPKAKQLLSELADQLANRTY